MKMRRLVVDNLVLKAFSIVIAMLAWVLIVGQQTIQETVEIALNVIPPSKQGLVIANEIPKYVKATVKGARAKLRGIEKVKYRTTIDLRDMDQGARVVMIPIQNLQFPMGVEVQRLTPSAVNVIVDGIGEKMVDVEPRIEGEPEEGFYVSSATVEPKQVKVLGPRSVLRNRKMIMTKPISVVHRTGNFSVQTALEPPSDKFSCDETVRVDVTIDEIVDEKEFSGVKVKILTDGSAVGHRFKLHPETIKVKLKGVRNDLREISSSDIEAVVRADELKDGAKTKVRPQVHVPQNTELKGIEPAFLQLLPSE